MLERILLVVFVVQLYSKASSQSGYLEEVCLQPADEGYECKEGQPETQYYFSKESEECLRLNFKGCGGNANRFKAQDDCTDACQVEWYMKKNKKSSKNPDPDSSERSREDCYKPLVKGPCRAMIKQWYYDKGTGQCSSFMYGGCKGNGNRFNSKEQCQSVCLTQ